MKLFATQSGLWAEAAEGRYCRLPAPFDLDRLFMDPAPRTACNPRWAAHRPSNAVPNRGFR